MLHHLTQKQTKLDWIGLPPGENKKTALLVPQYNEGRHDNFEKRLEYFDLLSRLHQEMDVIIIDDGSTDDSLQRLANYRDEHSVSFFIASIYPNGNKVGALFKTAISISHEIIILSDFDTDLAGIDELIGRRTNPLMEDASLMGYYFRMLPYEGSGIIFLFQQLEYSLHRVLYRFHQTERSIRVMPGAGSCYKREVLLSIYQQHSGLRNGEDREATLIGLKLGYKTTYQNKILALTRPPLSFRNLIKQRIRWNLGYLETFSKENAYYLSEMAALSRIGVVTMIDIATVIFILLFPFLVTLIGLGGLKPLLTFFASLYIVTSVWQLIILLITPKESEEFKDKRIGLILIYPFFKIALDYLAWSGAIYKMISTSFKSKYHVQRNS